MREAANCSLLRRNFQYSPLLLVPEVHWDYCSSEVMVMERMSGIPISQVDRLVEAGIDLKRLSRAGVELFFTQVFRDAYFHADMHPGNIFIATDGADHGKYIAVDFGIMGTLSREGPELPRAELPRLLPPRLPSRRDRAHRVGLGAARHAHRRARSRDPRRAASRSSTGR